MNKNSTKLTIIILLLVTGTLHTVSAQVYQKFGTNAFDIDKSAALEVNSNKKGFLPPRLSEGDRNKIGATDGTSNTVAATGLVIYNTTRNRLEVNVGTNSPGGANWESATVTSRIDFKFKNDADVTTGKVYMDDYGNTVLCNTKGGSFTLNLPAHLEGRVYTIGKIDDTDTELKFSDDLILPGGAKVRTLNYAKVFRIQSDGGAWHVLE